MHRYKPEIQWYRGIASPMMAEDSVDGRYYYKDEADKEIERLRALLRSVQVNAVIPGELESDIEHAIGALPQTPEHGDKHE
jgi:hypothetical protein